MDIVESSGGFISRSYKEFLSSAGIPLPSAKNEDKLEEYSQFYFSKLMTRDSVQVKRCQCII